MHSNLSQAIESELRRRVIDGRLAAGSRINEVHLSRALEVSRTPLREALTRLVGESFLEARPRHGFFVRAISSDEVDQLYQIRANLDPWALSLAGLPSLERIDELRTLNREIRGASGDAADVFFRVKRIELDDRWHLALIGGCGNDVLLDLIRQMMWRTRRYEYAYLGSGENVEVAGTQHVQILDLLAEGELILACEALRLNMITAIEPLRRWIDGPVCDPK